MDKRFILAFIVAIFLNYYTIAKAGIETLKERLLINEFEVETKLSDEWLVVTLDENKSIDFWDIHLQAKEKSSFLLGLNSEFIFVIVVDGHIKSHDKSVSPGKVLLFRHLGSVPDRLMTYSAKELKKLLESYGRDDLAGNLTKLEREQKCKVFWGLLRPTTMNVSSPLPKNVEKLRKNYSTVPEVIEIKREVDDIEQLPKAVAESFLTSAYAKNISIVAALLSPDAFRVSAQKGRFKIDREFIAKKLVLQSWAEGYTPDSLEETDQPLQYSFISNGKTYLIDMTVFDSTVFVQKISEVEHEN